VHFRREFLKYGVGALGGLVIPQISPGLAAASELADAPRRAAFQNLHTGEKIDAVYFENGAYVPDALQAVNKVLRDFRTGEVHPMDKSLLDLLHVLSGKVETKKPFQIISAYRSSKTNAMLRAKGGAHTGVATKSLHMDGKAMDVRLDGVQLAHLRDAALSMKLGGVGFYPQSNFVHVDTGRVRRWQGA
jgi:uncharacterized protein YcbK (DUF882 family)